MEPPDRRLRCHARDPRDTGARADGPPGASAGDRVGTAALPRVPRARGGVGRRPRGGDHARGVSRHDGGRRRGRRPLRLHRPGVAAGRGDAPGLLQDRARSRLAPRRQALDAAGRGHGSASRSGPGAASCRRTRRARRDHGTHPPRRAVVPQHGQGSDDDVPRSARQLRLRAVGRRHGGARRAPHRRHRWSSHGAEGRDRLARKRKRPAPDRDDGRTGVGDRARRRAHLPLRRERAPPSLSRAGAPASPAG